MSSLRLLQSTFIRGRGRETPGLKGEVSTTKPELYSVRVNSHMNCRRRSVTIARSCALRKWRDDDDDDDTDGEADCQPRLLFLTDECSELNQHQRWRKARSRKPKFAFADTAVGGGALVEEEIGGTVFASTSCCARKSQYDAAQECRTTGGRVGGQEGKATSRGRQRRQRQHKLWQKDPAEEPHEEADREPHIEAKWLWSSKQHGDNSSGEEAPVKRNSSKREESSSEEDVDSKECGSIESFRQSPSVSGEEPVSDDGTPLYAKCKAAECATRMSLGPRRTLQPAFTTFTENTADQKPPHPRLTLVTPKTDSDVFRIVKTVKRSTNLLDRLKSIILDAMFVRDFVASLHEPQQQPNFPVIANLRCGLWYTPNFADMCYYKSTDAHAYQNYFSLTRTNLHLLRHVAESGGCIIVDSTKKGKLFPDALSKTVPVWCSTINYLLFHGTSVATEHQSDSRHGTENSCRKKDFAGGASSSEFASHSYPAAMTSEHSDRGRDESFLERHCVLPPWISAAESTYIKSRVPHYAQLLIRELPAHVLLRFRRIVRKPLRPVWVCPTLSCSIGTCCSKSCEYASCCVPAHQRPTDKLSWCSNVYPIICLCASTSVSESSEYVQGAADDEECWCPKGFHPDTLWKNVTSIAFAPDARALARVIDQAISSQTPWNDTTASTRAKLQVSSSDAHCTPRLHSSPISSDGVTAKTFCTFPEFQLVCCAHSQPRCAVRGVEVNIYLPVTNAEAPSQVAARGSASREGEDGLSFSLQTRTKGYSDTATTSTSSSTTIRSAAALEEKESMGLLSMLEATQRSSSTVTDVSDVFGLTTCSFRGVEQKRFAEGHAEAEPTPWLLVDIDGSCSDDVFVDSSPPHLAKWRTEERRTEPCSTGNNIQSSLLEPTKTASGLRSFQRVRQHHPTGEVAFLPQACITADYLAAPCPYEARPKNAKQWASSLSTALDAVARLLCMTSCSSRPDSGGTTACCRLLTAPSLPRELHLQRDEDAVPHKPSGVVVLNVAVSTHASCLPANVNSLRFLAAGIVLFVFYRWNGEGGLPFLLDERRFESCGSSSSPHFVDCKNDDGTAYAELQAEEQRTTTSRLEGGEVSSFSSFSVKALREGEVSSSKLCDRSVVRKKDVRIALNAIDSRWTGGPPSLSFPRHLVHELTRFFNDAMFKPTRNRTQQTVLPCAAVVTIGSSEENNLK